MLNLQITTSLDRFSVKNARLLNAVAVIFVFILFRRHRLTSSSIFLNDGVYRGIISLRLSTSLTALRACLLKKETQSWLVWLVEITFE